jgi:hypothetical protein
VAGKTSVPASPGRRVLGVVLAGASLLGLLLWGALTREPGAGQGPPQARPAARPAPATAEIRVSTVPWSVVVSVVDVKSGTAVPLPAPADTPLVIAVPPGRYRVTLVEPPPGVARAEREVTAETGKPALVALNLRNIEELVETLR